MEYRERAHFGKKLKCMIMVIIMFMMKKLQEFPNFDCQLTFIEMRV